MSGPEVLGLVALITLCLVYLFCRADAALDSRRWREWVRAVEAEGRRRGEWRRL